LDEVWKLLTAGLPAAIALIGVYMAGRQASNSQRVTANRAAREDAYAGISASEFTLSQAVVNCLNLGADFEYHHRMWMLEGAPGRDSLHLAEAQRRSVEQQAAIAAVAGELGGLAKAVGKARVAFRRSQELDGLFASVIDDYRTPTGKAPAESASPAELERWIFDSKAAAGSYVHANVGDPIRRLLSALREHIDDPLN
jgi:K+-sensing histidine kinase KdpD